MLTTDEPSADINQEMCRFAGDIGKGYLLFPSATLADALANCAALMQCLCEIQQEHYGVYLLNCMIRDTLLQLSTMALGLSKTQGEESNA